MIMIFATKMLSLIDGVQICVTPMIEAQGLCCLKAGIQAV